MISTEEFNNLSYGNVVLATSRDCTNTSKPHVCIIISDGTVQHVSGKNSKAVRYALCLSSTDSKERQYEFETNTLHQEIQKYYDSIESDSSISKLRYNEPITVLRNGIRKIFNCTLANMLMHNNLICDLLCSDKYIYRNLVNKGGKYQNHFVLIGELCPCYNFGQANANEVKICPECYCVVECELPDTTQIKYLKSQIYCWIEELKKLGFDEDEAYCKIDNPAVQEIIIQLERDKCLLIEESLTHNNDFNNHIQEYS